MDAIDEFCEKYTKEFDYYEQVAKLASRLLEAALLQVGIRALVTFRAKSPNRLREKLAQRNLAKKYRSTAEMSADIVDLAGVRVALYFPGDRSTVGRLIHETFLVQEERVFPSEKKVLESGGYKTRFSGYVASHYRVKIREDLLQPSERRYGLALIEMQVASVLMHAWSEVEHDLVYKPLSGDLSLDERQILDQINGLVQTGELALEQLQRSVERRVTSDGTSFGNHFELASFLLAKLYPHAAPNDTTAAVGRVDTLFLVLNQINLLQPEALSDLLDNVTLSSDEYVSEQIIDYLILSNRINLDQYELLQDSSARILDERRLSQQDEFDLLVGRFLALWSELERLLEPLVFSRADTEQRARIFAPTGQSLESLGLLSSPLVSEQFNRVRQMRNRVVHRATKLHPEELQFGIAFLEDLLKDWRLRAERLLSNP